MSRDDNPPLSLLNTKVLAGYCTPINDPSNGKTPTSTPQRPPTVAKTLTSNKPFTYSTKTPSMFSTRSSLLPLPRLRKRRRSPPNTNTLNDRFDTTTDDTSVKTTAKEAYHRQRSYSEQWHRRTKKSTTEADLFVSDPPFARAWAHTLHNHNSSSPNPPHVVAATRSRLWQQDRSLAASSTPWSSPTSSHTTIATTTTHPSVPRPPPLPSAAPYSNGPARTPRPPFRAPSPPNRSPANQPVYSPIRPPFDDHQPAPPLAPPTPTPTAARPTTSSSARLHVAPILDALRTVCHALQGVSAQLSASAQRMRDGPLVKGAQSEVEQARAMQAGLIGKLAGMEGVVDERRRVVREGRDRVVEVLGRVEDACARMERRVDGRDGVGEVEGDECAEVGGGDEDVESEEEEEGCGGCGGCGEDDMIDDEEEDEVTEMLRRADGALEAAYNGQKLFTTGPNDEDNWPAD